MGVLFESKAAIEPDYMRKKNAVEKKLGHKISNAEFENEHLKINGGGWKIERHRNFNL